MPADNAAMDPERYEWDEAKRVENVRRHGLDFAIVAQLDWSMAIIGLDDRRDYGETRFLAFAKLGGRLCALVYTRRGDVRRIISFRKANRREQAAYAAKIIGRRR